jgi:GT2 family glycosyltransferase
VNAVARGSLVIPSRNRPELLRAAVDSVLHGEARPAEIIVVDQSDAPHPSLAEMSGVAGTAINYLRPTTRGVSRARNAGLRAAGEEIVAFIDDDVLAAPDWWGVLLQAAVDAGPDGVVTGQVVPGEAEAPGAFAPSVSGTTTREVYQGRIGRDVLFSGNMAGYRATLSRIGGFDERLGPGTRYGAAEDNDLCYRLLESGCRIIYVPEAVVVHRAWRENAAQMSLRWAYGRGQGAFLAKHASLRDRHMLRRFRDRVRRHADHFLRTLRRERRPAWEDLASIAGLFSGAGEWLVRGRRRKQ